MPLRLILLILHIRFEEESSRNTQTNNDANVAALDFIKRIEKQEKYTMDPGRQIYLSNNNKDFGQK